eukprot:562545-Pelagomonas_calceolata.AAC.5
MGIVNVSHAQILLFHKTGIQQIPKRGTEQVGKDYDFPSHLIQLTAVLTIMNEQSAAISHPCIECRKTWTVRSFGGLSFQHKWITQATVLFSWCHNQSCAKNKKKRQPRQP